MRPHRRPVPSDLRTSPCRAEACRRRGAGASPPPFARAVLAGAIVLLPVATPAQTGPFMRFLGGGPPKTVCMLVTDVAGVPRGRVARCTDGDPTCDGDGRVDGTCLFAVRVCLDATDPGALRCHAEVMTGAQASSPAPGFAGLVAALEELPMPVAAPDTCTATVGVPLARHGTRPARATLRASVSMASGRDVRDRLTFVCARPPGATATFATLQRKIFTASCATFSCHGAGNAGGLTLAAGAAYANLVGVPPSNGAALAAGVLRVAPGDPDRSFLLQKLDGTLGPDEGQPMPRVGPRLPPTLIDLVRRWIVAGAPADASF